MSDLGDSGVRLAAISSAPLEVAQVLDALDDPASGGLNLFVGRVRDHDDGRAVGGLGYSAHPSAAQVLEEVAAEVAAEFGVRVAVVHRVGELALGDAAVVLATSSGHRDACFAASRALIDRLKQRVPIWKRQDFADGSSEWVGSP